MRRYALARGLLRPALGARRLLRGSQLEDSAAVSADRWATDSRTGPGLVTVAGDSIAAGLPPAVVSALPAQTIVNRGLPGLTIAEFASWVTRALVPVPGALFLQVGTNDVIRGLSPEGIRSAYDDLLARCRDAAPACDVSVVALPPIAPWRADPRLHAAALGALEPSAAAHGVTYLAPWGGHDAAALLQRDGVHLTPAGYAVLGQAISEALSAAGVPGADARA